MTTIKKLWKCEHCSSLYELKKRANDCAENCINEIIKRHPQFRNKTKPIVTKYEGELHKVIDRQNRQ